MDILLKILDILPSIEFIETFLIKNPLELTVSRQFYEIINAFSANERQFDEQTLNDTYVMIDATKDHLWEIINTGHFSRVNKMDRQLFTLASLQKAVLLLTKAHYNLLDQAEAREKSMWELDNGLLLGCPLPHSTHCNILSDCLTILQSDKCIETDGASESSTFDTKSDLRLPNENCDVDLLDQPSIDHFRTNHFDKSRPGILKNCMNQWPAMTKWPQPNYLLEMCRMRVVPIEIGKNYTKENWSQDLVKFEDFFRRQFLASATSTETKRIEYLAQHNLFDQIPALKADILTPEYCCCTTDKNADAEIDVDIKAWLGPEGTTSPMHIDEKNNLLCQVFGSKRIVLAAPSDTANLYPFDGDMLKNTSQIDAEHPDYNRFPLLRHVTFYSFTLHPGEMLYIPPKWWHFVRSLSKSFSVSFWWQ